MNPILRFLRAFATYAGLMTAVVVARQAGLTTVVYLLGAAAGAALIWCLVCVFKAVGYDPH